MARGTLCSSTEGLWSTPSRQLASKQCKDVPTSVDVPVHTHAVTASAAAEEHAVNSDVSHYAVLALPRVASVLQRFMAALVKLAGAELVDAHHRAMVPQRSFQLLHRTCRM